MKKIAVIGLGCAGYHCIRAIREIDQSVDIHVYTETEHAAANPMLTTYYVAEKIPRNNMFPFGSISQLEKEYRVIVHTGTKVNKVLTSDKRLVLDHGLSEPFDQILIATGAKAVAPNLGQRPEGRTFLMRTVADADRLKAMLEKRQVHSAIVAGASMVGIKVVELLMERGIKTVMLDMADRLFPLASMPETASILEADLRQRGAELLLQTGMERVEETDMEVTVSLKNKSSLKADILILCIGTRANVELVANTEVVDKEPVKVNRGIVTDTHMQSSIPGIYAAGDCCEALNIQTGQPMIIGLWANAAEQGRVAGLNMVGVDAEYQGSVPNNITHYFDQLFIGIGDPNLNGEHFCFTENNEVPFNKIDIQNQKNRQNFASAIVKDGKISCINLLGNYRVSGMIRDYLYSRIRGSEETISPEVAGLMQINGLPYGLIALLKANTCHKPNQYL